ncbi:hypothetical protein V6N12_052419 [Hibiscus sabdariffa]|uniref:Uncharacterized protein n=1 Tax=Hibiscus sabdariffa TaxID=183260 RepID=A0ABR2GK28_9ROSI
MANAERVRRHFSIDVNCPLYGFRDETISHLFGFARLLLLYGNSSDWDLIFGYVIWNLWLSRNAFVFDNPLEDNGSILQRSLRLKELSCRVRAAGQVLPIDGNKSTSPTLWWCPPPDWHKINTDTSRVLVDGRASGIGMVRDHLGRWRLGFHKFIDSAPRPNLTIHYRNRTKPWIRSGF